MKMKRIIILIIALICIAPVYADVNVTTNIDSGGGSVNFWASSNSGSGLTTYYIDGVNYRQSINAAANSRGAIVSNVYRTFMDWRRQPTGGFGWEETDFNSLDPSFKRLRYVLESWFVPRSELVQIINKQQAQIFQLQLEIEAIGKVLGEDKICEARQLVMREQGLPSVTCGNRTVYSNGISLEIKS